MLYPAYVFCGEQLAVDAARQLPLLAQHSNDLYFTPLYAIDEQPKPERIIVRPLRYSDSLPDGLHLVAFRQLLTEWSPAEFEQAARAKQLLEWHNNHQFCCRCGHRTHQHRLELAMVCGRCHYRQYPRISPCVITIIRQQQKILLAKGQRSTTGSYGLIAGFVEVGETLEQAVQRETLEEVGINLKNIRYIGSQPWPFPSNLMLAFEAEYADGDLTLQQDEIADAQFFDIEHLPLLPQRGSIAYRMIEDAVAKIRAENNE